MAIATDRYLPDVRPLPAALLAGATALFVGAMLSDVAYASSYQIQWNNFASWLIAGGLVLGTFPLLFAVVHLGRASQHSTRRFVYPLLLLAMWVLGFINALVHARDAWASMPTGLVLSVMVAVLACLATLLCFSSMRGRGTT